MAKTNTYIPRDEVVDLHKEINMVRKKAEEELREFPGVVAVGVGLKVVKGEVRRQPCFKVIVGQKKPLFELKSNEVIPDTIYGYPTDVNVIGKGEETLNEKIPNVKRHRPLIGGSKIQLNSNRSCGTLGCFAKRNSDGKIVFLSNWHVLVDNPDQINGPRLGQPTHNNCCVCCSCNEIGVTVDGRYKTDDMDAAIGLLHGQDSDAIPEEKYLNEILNIGLVAGSTAPLSMETVYKYGFTTGLSEGQITCDNYVTNLISIYDPTLVIIRNNQLEITPINPSGSFGGKGDSGSVILNEKQEVVGLLFSVHSTTGIGFATPITTILNELGITILDSTFHKSETGKEGVPLRSSPPRMANIENLASALEEVEAEFNQYSLGKRIMGLFKLHQKELLGLVNHRREVMAAWNRYQGPAFLAHIARSVRREHKPIPEQIKGVTLQNLLLKMTAVLQRNGSPELARSVTDNYLQIMNVLSSGNTPGDWKEYLGNYERG